MSAGKRRIYLDNAATSWPKPESVYDSVDSYQRNNGSPFGRGSHESGEEVQRIVTRCRQRAAQLLGVQQPERVIFTFNATHSLNLAIHGLLSAGDHVVTTTLEHNSVTRPLRFLKDQANLEVTSLKPNGEGVITPEAVKSACRANTRLVAIIHASNVTGTIQPINQIGELTRNLGIPLLVDAAQTAGVLPIAFDDSPFDLLACAGHKGLLGPLGTGLLCLTQTMSETLSPLMQGGTGTESELATQPRSLPARFESGNHNVPGLVGLNAGLDYLLERGINKIRQHELELTMQLGEGFKDLNGVILHSPPGRSAPLALISVTSQLYDPQTLATLLSQEFGIETRAGLHCAPGVHDWMGTKENGGTLRLSLGPFSEPQDIADTLTAFRKLHSV